MGSGMGGSYPQYDGGGGRKAGGGVGHGGWGYADYDSQNPQQRREQGGSLRYGGGVYAGGKGGTLRPHCGDHGGGQRGGHGGCQRGGTRSGDQVGLGGGRGCGGGGNGGIGIGGGCGYETERNSRVQGGNSSSPLPIQQLNFLNINSQDSLCATTPILVSMHIGNCTFTALVDTGAGASLISEAAAQKLLQCTRNGASWEQDNQQRFTLADQSVVPSLGKIICRALISSPTHTNNNNKQ